MSSGVITEGEPKNVPWSTHSGGGVRGGVAVVREASIYHSVLCIDIPLGALRAPGAVNAKEVKEISKVSYQAYFVRKVATMLIFFF